jgi:flagellar basal body-associated protein FliL
MDKKRIIIIIAALIIGIAAACFLMPWKIWDNEQNPWDQNQQITIDESTNQ